MTRYLLSSSFPRGNSICLTARGEWLPRWFSQRLTVEEVTPASAANFY
jgi:hypothetical protein